MIAATPDAADILLYVNSPAELQGNGYDQLVLLMDEAAVAALPPESQAAYAAYRKSPHLHSTFREMHSVQRNVLEFVRSLAHHVAAGQSCAVVDVAYVNGADIELGDALRRHVDIAQLCGYGAWNTAGNTLGTVLAHAVIRHLQRTQGASADALAAHLRFLFLRFVDDYLYQGLVRTQVAGEVLPPLGMEPRMTDLGAVAAQVEGEVARRLTAAASDLSTACFAGHTVEAGNTRLTIDGLSIDNVFLPWHRLFEVGCEVKLRMG